MTIRQDIRDRVIFELNDAAPTGVPDCTKRRYIPGQKFNDPIMAAFFASEDVSRPQHRAGAIASRKLRLIIQVVVAVNDPADADDAIEPMLEHIVSIMGDTSLNRLTTNVSEMGTVWASGEAGKFYLAALTNWDIEYQTDRNDLNAKQ